MAELGNIRFKTLWEFLRHSYENEPVYINKLKTKLGVNAMVLALMRDVCLEMGFLEITKTTGRTRFHILTAKGRALLGMLDDFFIEPND